MQSLRAWGTSALTDAVIAATGLYTPPYSLSNAELVETFNAYVERFNAANAEAIAAGEVQPLTPPSAEFIEKAPATNSRSGADRPGPANPDRRSRTIPKPANK